MSVAVDMRINRPKTITDTVSSIAKMSSGSMYNVTRRRTIHYIGPDGSPKT